MTAPGATPGPWITNGRGGILASEDYLVCEVGLGWSEENDPSMAADMHLIAASPALYDALENLLAVVRGEGGTKYHAHEIAESALALARGEAA